MLSQFERAILALGEAIAWERHPEEGAQHALGKSAADFLLSVHGLMPDYLRPLFHILVLLFNAWPLLRRGRFFHQLSLDERLAELDKWRHSRFEFRRRFVEFHASLALFDIYSDLYGQDYRYDTLPAAARPYP